MVLIFGLFSSFQAPTHACHISYQHFCKSVDETFIQDEYPSKSALHSNIIHLPNLDCINCFLNFDERTVVSKALQKFTKYSDQISNLREIFTDYDRENCGTVTQEQFLRALATRDLHYVFSSREFECICKAFGVERGLRIEFDYRAFLNILDVLFDNKYK